MIEAKDLRIGNWVTRQSSGKDYQIDANGIGAAVDYPKIVKPIPLNEEWLIKFGFMMSEIKMSGADWHVINLKDNQLRLTNHDDKWAVTLDRMSPTTWILTEIEYVHQLQNLIHSLTNTELEIKV